MKRSKAERSVVTIDEARAIAMWRWLDGRVALERKHMDGSIQFNEYGEYVSAFCRPELGPLRPSQLKAAEKSELPPPWAYLDHDELPYVTTADHRSVEGRIVALGTRCLVSRKNGVVMLRAVDSSPEHVVVLDASRWTAPVEGAPVLTPAECPELFLPA